MPASVRLTRLVLRSVYATASTGTTTTLLVGLRASAFASAPAVLASKQLIEAQADGVVSKYQFPIGGYGIQAQDVAEMWSRLLDLYDQALLPTTSVPPGGGFTAESGTTPSQAIYTWMMGQLQVIRSYGTDFSQPGIRT